MDGIKTVWIYLIIIVAGLLQAWGPPMNGALRKSLVNPWLASLVSFLPIVDAAGTVLRNPSNCGGDCGGDGLRRGRC